MQDIADAHGKVSWFMKLKKKKVDKGFTNCMKVLQIGIPKLIQFAKKQKNQSSTPPKLKEAANECVVLFEENHKKSGFHVMKFSDGSNIPATVLKALSERTRSSARNLSELASISGKMSPLQIQHIRTTQNTTNLVLAMSQKVTGIEEKVNTLAEMFPKHNVRDFTGTVLANAVDINDGISFAIKDDNLTFLRVDEYSGAYIKGIRSGAIIFKIDNLLFVFAEQAGQYLKKQFVEGVYVHSFEYKNLCDDNRCDDEHVQATDDSNNR